MKQVVLIGDSIRMGYQPVVVAALRGVAEVWGPKANGGDSSNVLAHLDEWAIERKPDIVHANAGLHDIKRPFGAKQNQVPIERYRENLEAVFRRVTEETEAILIWAKTTPVNERWHHQRKGFDRFEADVEAYNGVALDLARAMGVPLDDLTRAALEAGRDTVLNEDGVHFTPRGYNLLGKAVADCIRACLAGD